MNLEQMVRAWDAVSEAYVGQIYRELDAKPFDRELLVEFRARVNRPDLAVSDLGCGPGHTSAYLTSLGLKTSGLDISPAMIAHARRIRPDLDFEVGDMCAADWEPSSLAGAVAMYSLSFVRKRDISSVLQRLTRGIVSGGPVLVAVHTGDGEAQTDDLLGQGIAMSTNLFSVEEMTGLIRDAGLSIDLVRTRPPYPGEYPYDRAYVIASNG